MPGITVVDDARMNLIAHPQALLQQLTNRAVWSEGPVYFLENDSIVWSDRLLRWNERDGVKVIRQPSHYQNGNGQDLEGRLVSCSSGDRAIIRQEHSGAWTILVDRY
jgi:gluconolactonase